MAFPSHEVAPSGLVQRLEQAFELALALAVGLATPVAGLVVLMAMGSMSLDVVQVGERLVRWGGAGQGGIQGIGAGVVVMLAPPSEPVVSPDEPPRSKDADAPATDESPSVADTDHEGEAGPARGPVELGGGPESLLGAVTDAEAALAPPADTPGPGLPWGSVQHGTGGLHGGGGGGSEGAVAPRVALAIEPSPLGAAGSPWTHTVDAAGGMRFVAVAGGAFWMGSPVEEPGRFANEGPLHRVHLSPYWLSKTEVTTDQWRAVMGSVPLPGGAGDLPVVGVSWCDALRYANALSAREGLRPVYRFRGSCGYEGTVTWERGADGYRLPTEAEWELAARAGDHGIFAGSHALEPVGWYLGNAGGRARTVAALAPNAYGLHDMSGNVWEWVWDRLGPYAAEAQHDPAGPERGDTRILRGGSWRYEARYARVADRNWSRPGYRSPAVGFRLARSLRPGDLDALVSED
jgi:formylglycine-generating enzyme